MAKNKKDDATGFFIVLVIIVVLVVAAAVAVVTPFALVLGWAVNKARSKTISLGLLGTMSDFWLGEAERVEFRHKVNELMAAQGQIDQAKHRADVGKIGINKDGSYSQRSKVGKEIVSTIGKYTPITENLAVGVQELRWSPLRRWKEFSGYIGNAIACLWAFFAWTGVIGYYSITLGKGSPLQAVKPYFALSTDIFRSEETKIGLADGDVKMIAVATGASLVLFLVLKYVHRNAATKFSPRPVEVTLDNVDCPG